MRVRVEGVPALPIGLSARWQAEAHRAGLGSDLHAQRLAARSFTTTRVVHKGTHGTGSAARPASGEGGAGQGGDAGGQAPESGAGGGKKPGRLKAFVRDYGTLGLVTWTGLYLVGVPILFVGFRAGDNFGVDPLAALDALGSREAMMRLVGVEDPSAPLSANTTAIMFAVAVNEVIEPLRWVVLVPLVRSLRRRLDARAAARRTTRTGRD